MFCADCRGLRVDLCQDSEQGLVAAGQVERRRNQLHSLLVRGVTVSDGDETQEPLGAVTSSDSTRLIDLEKMKMTNTTEFERRRFGRHMHMRRSHRVSVRRSVNSRSNEQVSPRAPSPLLKIFWSFLAEVLAEIWIRQPWQTPGSRRGFAASVR